MTSAIRELMACQQLLQVEKEAEFAEYRNKIFHSSIKHRKKEGITWYPVRILRHYIGMGERLVVEAERTLEKGAPHGFQSGKLVSLFSQTQEAGENRHSVRGIINYINGDLMSFSLYHDELPEWAGEGRLGINLMFDEISYIEMEKALRAVISAENNRLAELREILLSGGASRQESGITCSSHYLNSDQVKALQLVLHAGDVAFIHGPPGTGKTTTLVESIIETLKTENQVLVCAPSNAAVDLLTEKIFYSGIPVVRLGHPSRVTDASLDKTLDSRLMHHPDFAALKNLRKRIEEFKRLASRYRRNFGKEEMLQRKLLLTEAKKMRGEADHLESYMVDTILTKTSVITSTLVGAAAAHLRDLKFGTVFIDEASQALEPATWIPVSKARRVIFAGDHHQLPPTVKSRGPARQGLSVTLFEKGISRNTTSQLLTVQYRMNEKIMGFSNLKFYENKLIASPKVKNWKIADPDDPLLFIDTAGCGYFEEQDPETGSIYNREEAGLLIEVLEQYVHHYYPWLKDADIGIITPYRAQVEGIRKSMDNLEMPHFPKERLQVNTVDSFQGQERDVILISLVRSNDRGDIGFLSDERRMNVALTRARKKLIVIGDSATIGHHEFYRQFIQYMDQNGAYKSAFEINRPNFMGLS